MTPAATLEQRRKAGRSKRTTTDDGFRMYFPAQPLLDACRTVAQEADVSYWILVKRIGIHSVVLGGHQKLLLWYSVDTYCCRLGIPTLSIYPDFAAMA